MGANGANHTGRLGPTLAAHTLALAVGGVAGGLGKVLDFMVYLLPHLFAGILLHWFSPVRYVGFVFPKMT
jgi:hypothetical protein